MQQQKKFQRLRSGKLVLWNPSDVNYKNKNKNMKNGDEELAFLFLVQENWAAIQVKRKVSKFSIFNTTCYQVISSQRIH